MSAQLSENKTNHFVDINKKQNLTVETVGYITWHLLIGFLIEVEGKKYEWNYRRSDGDNFIKPYTGNENSFINRLFKHSIEGSFRIGDFCGNDVVFLDCH